MFLGIATSAIVANVLKNATAEDLKFVKDDNTILIFRILMPSAVVLAFLVAWFDPWKFDASLGFDGVCLLVYLAGLSLRWTAIGALKKAFTVKVSILKDHKLKTDGVYGLVRHPSYTGMYIYGFAYGMAFHSLLVTALVLMAVWVSTHKRMPLEEAVLESHFGEDYRIYKSKTWRLFPWIY